jgi:hypothetical protein
MKQLVDVAGEGLVSFLGKRITLFCLNYIYTGNLVGVNDKFVKLDDAAIVYETGPLCAAGWQDAQKLPNATYVMLASVESFMELK